MAFVTVIAAAVSLGACATPKRGSSDGGNRDLGSEPPLDFAEPSSELDLLRTPRDLSGTGLIDLSGLPGIDLKGTPVDMASGGPLDMTSRPVDMTSGGSADMATVCTPPVAGGLCDTSPQCGCTGGQNCNVTNNTTGATSCVAAGATNNYASCSTTAAVCKVGSSCVGGVCAPFCETTADCPGNYRQCVQVVSGSTDIPGFKVCSQTCDPTSPTRDDATYDPCGPGVSCWPSTDRSSFCVGPTTASGTQYADCTNGASADDSLCAPGYLCLDDIITLYACYKMCRYGVAGSCPSGYTCYSLTFGSSPVYAGPYQIGVCDL